MSKAKIYELVIPRQVLDERLMTSGAAFKLDQELGAKGKEERWVLKPRVYTYKKKKSDKA